MRSVFTYSLYPNTLEEESKDLNICVDFSFFCFGGEGAHNNVLDPLINFPKSFPHSGLVFLEILFSLLKLLRFCQTTCCTFLLFWKPKSVLPLLRGLHILSWCFFLSPGIKGLAYSPGKEGSLLRISGSKYSGYFWYCN